MRVAISFLCVFAASAVQATVVSWNPKPSGTESVADPAEHTFVLPGPSTLAGNGYTTGGPSQRFLGLSDENQEFGQTIPDMVRLAGHQGQENGFSPVQFDLSSILSQGLVDEKVQLRSVQISSNNGLAGWESSLGNSDAQSEGISDSSSDLAYANIANSMNDKLISIGALSGVAIPLAFQATLTPVPEMSALFPIIGLIAAVAITQILRRRRIAQLRAATSATQPAAI